MKRLSFLLLLFYASVSYASSPLVYSKTVITILPASEGIRQGNNKEEGKKAEDSKLGDLIPGTRRTRKEFTVEVRPLSFLNQNDFISHQPFRDKEGMMFIIDPPDIVPLKSSNILGEVDIVFVSEDGIIEQIAPHIDLSDINEPIQSDKKVKAIIFLGKGSTSANDIRPNDHIESQFFKTHPVILQ